MSMARTVAALLFLLSLGISGCDESLPPRNDPQAILVANFSTQTRLITLDEFNIRKPRMVLRISLRSNHDEVLQDTANVRGDVVMYLRDYPKIKKTFEWREADIQTPGIVRGRLATLQPRVEFMLSSEWDQMSDMDAVFWKFGHYTKKFTTSGQVYLESDSLFFVAEGRVQLFKYGPAIKAPKLVFGIIYQLMGFGELPDARGRHGTPEPGGSSHADPSSDPADELGRLGL
jgi:hypothetical protein